MRKVRGLAFVLAVVAVTGCGTLPDHPATFGDQATPVLVSATTDSVARAIEPPEAATSADDISALPPVTLKRVRWSGAIVVQLIDAPQAPVAVCSDVHSVDPDSCFDSESGYSLRIDSGLASIAWGIYHAEGGRQAKVDLVADWNPSDLSQPPFANGVVSPYQPADPATYRCPNALKTGSMSTQDAYLHLDVQGLSGSRALGGSINGNSISWQIMSVDRTGFDAICSSVGPQTNVEITVALTPVGPDPARSTECPGSDPLAVAAAFLTSVRAGDADLYVPCIYPGSDRDPDSLLSEADWVTTIQSGDYQLDDEFERLPNMFSFGSPDLPPCTCAGLDYIDPNGRADVTVSREPDGLYYVTKLGFEVHG
ncbi:MAG: hypothetical protein QOJ66_2985 [Ilumatobacteraceae bacterium]